MNPPSVALILAAVDGERPSSRSIEAFLREAKECNGVVWLIDATLKGCDLPASDQLRIIRRPASTLVPELWTIGLRESRGKWVALSTTCMVPESGWLKSLIQLCETTGASLVGSGIRPFANLNRLDRAVYLCRYVSYLEPQVGTSPAGENVLYDRALLDTVESCWQYEFWEAEVHQELKRGDAPFYVEPSPGLFYIGGSRWIPLLTRRFVHARRYGSTRPLGRPGRLRVIGTPVVPALMGWRAFQSLRRARFPMRRFTPGVWIRSLLLNSVWAIGEATGICRRRPAMNQDSLVLQIT